MSERMTLRSVEDEGVGFACWFCDGMGPWQALNVDDEGGVWHDGSEFGGDILCHGPFDLFSSVSSHAPREPRG